MLKQTTRERAYIELSARDMHPDLYADIPLTPEAEQLQIRYTLDAQLADLRKIFLHEDVPPQKSLTTRIAINSYTSDWNKLTENEVLTGIRKCVAALRSLGGFNITKEYTDYSFDVKVTMPSGLVVTVQAARDAICTKRVVGTEYVPPTGGYTKEITEWDCKPVSLIKGA